MPGFRILPCMLPADVPASISQVVLEPPSQGCHEAIEVLELGALQLCRVTIHELQSLLGLGDNPDFGFLAEEGSPIHLYVDENLSQK